MQIEKIEQTGPYLVIAGSLMHIFCCGIPLFLSLTNLTAIFGLSTLGSFELEWFERIEPYVLVSSGIILLLTFAGVFLCQMAQACLIL